jgi:NADH-quinone oxidoreductase subunit J
VVLAAELVYFFYSTGLAKWKAQGTPPPSGLVGNTQQVGWALYMKYLLPFEVASVLLLVAIIGAIIFTRKREAGD